MNPPSQPNLTTTRPDPRDSLKKYLELRAPRLKAVLPEHTKPEHVVALTLLAANKQPKLLDCTPDSVFLALMGASHLDLDVSGVTGEAYLIPFGRDCQLIIGYRGMVTLCHRAGVRNVSATPVFEGEPFEMVGGTKPGIRHQPNPEAVAEYDRLRGVYVTWTETGRDLRWHWMNKGDINKRRQVSQQRDGPTWRQWPIEMAKKTAVRAAFKLMPKSSTWQQDLRRLVEQPDGQQALLEMADTPDVVETTATEVKVDGERTEGTAQPNP